MRSFANQNVKDMSEVKLKCLTTLSGDKIENGKTFVYKNDLGFSLLNDYFDPGINQAVKNCVNATLTVTTTHRIALTRADLEQFLKKGKAVETVKKANPDGWQEFALDTFPCLRWKSHWGNDFDKTFEKELFLSMELADELLGYDCDRFGWEFANKSDGKVID